MSANSAALTAGEREALLNAARAAVLHAYAPYSKFRVGAAVLTEAKAIYTGCNVENASYGLTNCAERTAIFTAVANEGPGMRVRAVGVWSQADCVCPPCGACRQVIWEFGKEAVVLYRSGNGVETKAIRDLLPEGFKLESGN
ncbi:MAG: cytidine deaminase [Terriglobales bacterium]